MNPLLLQIGGPPKGAYPLNGIEQLDAEPACEVSGVMFAARKEFLIQRFGDRAFYAVVAKLSPATMKIALSPSADKWYSYSSLIEYDRATHDTLAAQCPYVIEALGAASAELGITRVYRKLDEGELQRFLQQVAAFHTRYQTFGRAEVEPRSGATAIRYTDYHCYSPVYCASAIGFFLEAIMRHGGNDANVEHTRCYTRGDSVDEFVLTWSTAS